MSDPHDEDRLMDSSPSEADRDPRLAIRFHGPPELKGRVPVPIPAAEGLPTWLREKCQRFP